MAIDLHFMYYSTECKRIKVEIVNIYPEIHRLFSENMTYSPGSFVPKCLPANPFPFRQVFCLGRSCMHCSDVIE